MTNNKHEKSKSGGGSGSAVVTVLPGDDLTYLMEQDNASSSLDNDPESKRNVQTKLGTGLVYKDGKITATLAGRLVSNTVSSKSSSSSSSKSSLPSRTCYILTNSKRYIPSLNDRVICIVEERIGEYYRVTIPSSSTSTALLPTIAFEGATKRNRPMLQSGALLYARISTCHSHVMEPQVSCTVLAGEESHNSDGGASRKDWMTDEGTYGQLKGGSTAQVSLGLARELLKPTNVVLAALSTTSIPFEICIGVNGLIWVHSTKPVYTILILNAVQNSEVMTEDQIRGMVKSLVATLSEEG